MVIANALTGNYYQLTFKDNKMETINSLETETKKQRAKLADLIAGSIQQDAREIAETVAREVLEKYREVRTVIEVKQNEQTTEVSEAHHYLLPLAIKLAASSLNVCLTGPAGCGKTTLWLQAAKALNQNFQLVTYGPDASKGDILGRVTADGKYLDSPVKKAMQQGTMLIVDEFDSCDPSIALLLNAILANRICTFADGETLEAHPNFRMVFSMNTLGLGADRKHVGRNRLDSATLDRLVVLNVDYDENLEASLLGLNSGKKEVDLNAGIFLSPDYWLNIIKEVRRMTANWGWEVTYSPRATLQGAELIKLGIASKWIAKLILYKGLSPDQIDKLKQFLVNNYAELAVN